MLDYLSACFDAAEHFHDLAGDLALASAVVRLPRLLIISSAFSVAAFIATIRAICSLTAASKKHLNSFTLKLVGTTSSKMLSAEGRNSYCDCSPSPSHACPSLVLRLRGHVGAPQRAERQQRLDHGRLLANARETRVGHVEPIEIAGDVGFQIAIGQHFDFVERDLIFEMREFVRPASCRDNEMPKCRAYPTLPFATFGTVAVNSCQRAAAVRTHVAVVSAAQAAIGGQHQQDRTLGFLAPFKQRMADFQAAIGQIGHELRDALGVGRGGMARSIAFLKRRSGDQLHRPRNLADVADRLAAFVEGSGLGHAVGSVMLASSQ